MRVEYRNLRVTKRDFRIAPSYYNRVQNIILPLDQEKVFPRKAKDVLRAGKRAIFPCQPSEVKFVWVS